MLLFLKQPNCLPPPAAPQSATRPNRPPEWTEMGSILSSLIWFGLGCLSTNPTELDRCPAGSMVPLTDQEWSIEEFLNQEESLLARWLAEIKKWSSKVVNYCERRIWVIVTRIWVPETIFSSSIGRDRQVLSLLEVQVKGDIAAGQRVGPVVGEEVVNKSGVREGGVMGLDDLQSSEGVANIGPIETGPQKDKVKRRKLGDELDVVGLDRYVEEGNNNNKGEGQTNNPDKIRDEKGGDAVKKRGRKLKKLNSVATLGPLTNLELCSKRSRAVSPARNVTRRKSSDAIPSRGRRGRRSLSRCGRMGGRSASRGGLGRQKTLSKEKGSLLKDDTHSNRCRGETSRAKVGRGQRAVRLRSGNSDFGLSGAYMPGGAVQVGSIPTRQEIIAFGFVIFHLALLTHKAGWQKNRKETGGTATKAGKPIGTSGSSGLHGSEKG